MIIHEFWWCRLEAPQIIIVVYSELDMFGASTNGLHIWILRLIWLLLIWGVVYARWGARVLGEVQGWWPNPGGLQRPKPNQVALVDETMQSLKSVDFSLFILHNRTKWELCPMEASIDYSDSFHWNWTTIYFPVSGWAQLVIGTNGRAKTCFDKGCQTDVRKNNKN